MVDFISDQVLINHEKSKYFTSRLKLFVLATILSGKLASETLVCVYLSCDDNLANQLCVPFCNKFHQYFPVLFCEDLKVFWSGSLGTTR